MGPLAGHILGQLTIGRLGTKMLRSSKTLQPCKDTRRLALVSMNQPGETQAKLSRLACAGARIHDGKKTNAAYN